MALRFGFALTCSLAMLLFGGCASQLPSPYMPHKHTSYLVRGHNYTFAIYNNEHRLLTHPVEDLLTEMKWRKTLNKPAISDIYLISHGWDYTLPLAIANYHNYMERIDHFMREEKPPAGFQPYFIFVTWASTTRPTTNMAKAILPFGMDSALEPLTNLIDKIPLNMLSAWKQSLNATQNALGPQYPNDYLGNEWKNKAYGYFDTGMIQDADAIMGEDVPVSALIYHLIKQKHVPAGAIKKLSNDCEKPDPLEPEDDVCVSLAKTQLHLVGHSYGAKLVTIAGMEALRRWMLETLAATPDKFRLTGCVPPGKRSNDFLQDLAVCDLTGHRQPFGELEVAFGGLQKPSLLKAWYEKTAETPIDSLVLFNPAFHPGELSYPVDIVHFAPTQTLRFIPRKAVVYTTYDYANGALFSLRENLLNTQITQMGNQASKKLDQLIYQSDNRWLRVPINVLQIAIGPLDLSYSLFYTHIGQVFYSLINIPWDFWHHVTTGTMGGLYDPIAGSGADWGNIAKGMANAMDFFLPTNMLYRNESEQGLFRLNKPGLGKTGLNHLAEGRWIGANLWGLEDYYSQREPFGRPEQGDGTLNVNHSQTHLRELKNLKKPPFAPNIGRDTFSRFTSRPLVTDMQADFDHNETLWLREKFYSFDAGKAYDSHTPFIGAHSDLRKPEKLNKKNGQNESYSGKDLEKRDVTFNFVVNFTKTHFERKFCELNPREIQEFGINCAANRRN